MSLSMERIKEFDKKWAFEVEKFLRMGVRYGSTPPLFLHRDYSTPGQLVAIAKEWKTPLADFLAYVKLQKYVNAAAQVNCEDLPFPEVIGEEIGISRSAIIEFVEYVLLKIREIHDAHAEEDDDVTGSGLLADDWDELETLLKEAEHIGN